MDARRVDWALCLGVIAVLTIVVTANVGNPAPVNPLAYLWAVGLGLLMLLRRSHPGLVLVLTTLGFFTYHAAGFAPLGVGVPMAAALFSAAEMGRFTGAIWTGVVVLAGSTAYRLAAGQGAGYILGYELVSHAALVGAAIVLGHSVRTARALRRRTEQVTGLLVRQQELDADARLQKDRLALARELHDSIGHSLSVAALYAQIAREADPDSPGRGNAMEQVRTAVTDALAQLRGTVNVLRNPATAFEADSAGLGDISHLAVAPRAAGYDVDVDLPHVDVPPEVAAVVHKVVQEAVTNTIRHSCGNHIQIAVSPVGESAIDVVVSDDGHVDGVPDLHRGHGLTGMRERVQDLGGSLEVTAGPDGWRVHATIPTTEET